MAQIVKCSEEVLLQIPNVQEYIYKIFGDKPLVLYAVLDNNRIGFIVRNFYNCLYIKNDTDGYSVIPFQLTENEEIGMVMIGDDHFFFSDDSMYMIDKEGIEHTLGIKAIDGFDPDNYNGFVFYAQYNKKNDTICDIRYQQMYREVDGKVPIYEYHTKKIDSVSIDEKYTKRGNNHFGIIPPRSKYFSKYEFNRDHMGYTLTALKDYGVFDVVTKGAYALHKEDKVIRYVKAFYLQKDGNFVDLWPFARQITDEELKDYIKSLGFRAEVPEELMAVYNGQDKIVLELQGLASQIKELGKCDDEEMCMILQLVPEDEDK